MQWETLAAVEPEDDRTEHDSPGTARPLAGLRVLELARILAGPWIGQTLADLGADVVKIESPTGDDTRGWGPPWVTPAPPDADPDAAVNEEERGDAAYFHACNRGKRSLVADLGIASERDAVAALAGEADVLIENFRVGGLVKFGLDAATLRARHPRLVYCSISGFGQDGPYANRPGYDFMIQGMAGIMSLTGEPDGAPMKSGVAFADIFTGLYGTIGIQSALAERARTGRGQHLDLSLFDCMSGVLANQAMNYLASGDVPRRRGNRHPNIAPYRTASTRDGHLIIAVGNQRQFARLCDVLDMPDMACDPRFASNALRVEHSDALDALLDPAIARYDRDPLLEALEQASVPAGPINDVQDLFADPQFIHRGMRIERKGVGGLRTPILFDGRPAQALRGAPNLGEAGRVDEP